MQSMFLPGWRAMSRCFVCNLLILCCSVGSGIAREQTLYKTLSTEHTNLTSNIIYRLFTDRRGYVWLATEGGLLRYNGSDFEEIPLKLNDNEVISMYSHGDRLYCFNISGELAVIDLNNYTVPDHKAVNNWMHQAQNNDPISVAAWLGDTLFLANMNKDMPVCYKAGNTVFCKTGRADFWNRLKAHYKVPADFPDAQEVYLAGGRRVFGLQYTDSSIIYENKIYTITKDSIQLLFDGACYGLSGTIMSFLRSGNDLWVAYYQQQGLVRLERFFDSSADRSHVPQQNFFRGERILHITRDRQQHLWVSLFNKGIALLPLEQPARPLSDPGERDAGYLQALDSNRILIAYRDSGFALCTGDSVRPLSLHLPAGDYNIKHIIAGRHSWTIFTASGIFTVPVAANGLPGKMIPAAMGGYPVKDVNAARDSYYVSIRSGFAVLGADAHALSQQQLAGQSVYSVAVLPDGNLALATLKGIWVNGQFIAGTQHKKYNLLRYCNGWLVACHSRGVQFIKERTVKKELSHEDGLYTGPYTDVQSRGKLLYILSREGINVIGLSSWDFVGAFGGRDFNATVAINAMVFREAQLLLATDKGVFVLDSAALFNRPVPAFYVGMMNSDGIYTPIDSAIRFWYHRDLNINLQADIFSQGGNQAIARYTLTDAAGHYRARGRIGAGAINLGNLAPGQYRLHVYVPYGAQRSLERTICIDVVPLWYQTFAFRCLLVCLCAALFITLSYALYTRRLNALKKRLYIRTRIAELQAQALFAQMKPHFIFNALNPLQGFILKNKQEEALDYLETFASLTRNLLNQSRDQLTSIANEVRFLEQYLWVAAKRFAGSFEYKISLAENTSGELLIPSMILQPLVENAIEHGVKGMPSGKVSISFAADPDSGLLTVCVADNGAGFEGEQLFKGNHALTIIRERLELMHRETGIGSIKLAQQEPGTTVMIELPLKYKLP